MPRYFIFYTGLASTPNSVGLKRVDTNEVICEISTSRKSGAATRLAYEKYAGILRRKYKSILK